MNVKAILVDADKLEALIRVSAGPLAGAIVGELTIAQTPQRTSDLAAVQRSADALYELAQSTGGGHCPPSWSGPWREWYRHVARVALTAAAYPEEVKA